MGYLGNQITTVFPTSISVDSATISGNASVGGTSTLTGAVSTGTSLTVANGLTLTDGNVTLASGHGIDFSATGNSSGSMTAELFDDYEEGTFVHSVSNFSGTKNTGFNVGEYTKIGNMVFIHGAVVYASGSVTGTTALFGLPFTIENVNQGHTIISYNGNVASTTINDNRRGSPNQSFFEIGVTSGTGDVNLVYHAMYTTA